MYFIANSLANLLTRLGHRSAGLALWLGVAMGGALGGALGLSAGSASAQTAALADIPPLAGRVNDSTLTLGSEARINLEAKLASFEQRKGSQIVVLVVASTQPEDVASYAFRAASRYKIGRKGVGDGILVVVATGDKRARIEVAKALEGAVPDLAARQVVQETMGPLFKTGDYAGGLNAGLDQLIGLVDGEALPPPKPKGGGSGSGQVLAGLLGGFDWQDLAIFMFVAVFFGGSVLRSVFGRGFGSLLTAGAAGGVGYFLTTSLVIAGVAGVIAMLISLFSALGSAFRCCPPGRRCR